MFRADGLIVTNKSDGLVFYRDKVWKTDDLAISDPKYEYLANAYPQLDRFDDIDSIFTFVDRDKKIRYCFIIQDSSFFLYLTQQSRVTLRHHAFTNQVFVAKFDSLEKLVHSSRFTNIFIRPMFCAAILPASNNTYTLFFFGFYTKYTTCNISLEYKKLNPNGTDSLTNVYPSFELTGECKVLRQGTIHEYEQECRFVSSRRFNESSGEFNEFILGQRKYMYYNDKLLSGELFFGKIFTKRLNYKDIWHCKKVSYRDYNTIKFLIIPMFIGFTISFIFLNSLFESKEDKFINKFAKAKHINKVYQKIRTDYLKNKLNE